MAAKKILIIEDDLALLGWLEQGFLFTGYQVYTAAEGETGLRRFLEHQPDAIVLDINLPTITGWEVCRRIRKQSNVPIIFITGMGSTEENVESLREGADDYLFKPFSIEVLIAKVEALLWRSGLPLTPRSNGYYCDDHLAVDTRTRDVFIRGESVHLRPKEFELLAYLVNRAGQIISHEQIVRDLWGWEGEDYHRNVHLYVGRLRRKIEPNPRKPSYILTVPHLGYRFRKRTNSEERNGQ